MVDRRPLPDAGQVSTYLGVPEGTLKKWRAEGKGPMWRRVGRHVRYVWEDVDCWLATQAEGGGNRVA